MRLLRHILVYQEKNERKNEMNKKCPHCGSSKTAPILYGYPILNEETKPNIGEQLITVSNQDDSMHLVLCKVVNG